MGAVPGVVTTMSAAAVSPTPELGCRDRTRHQHVVAFAIEDTTATRRVVLTAGLLHALPDPALRRAVIEHEQAHLRHHHLLYRLAAESSVQIRRLNSKRDSLQDIFLKAMEEPRGRV